MALTQFPTRPEQAHASMGGEEEKPRQEADDSIRVICRIRPLNKSEEAAGSKFVCSFPSSRGQEDQMVSVGVSGALFLR